MTNGTCGKNLKWQLDNKGTLTIRGKGKMYNGAFHEVSTSIKRVEVRRGVTSIGKENFVGCENLENANLPDGVKMIGKGAFRDCKKLTDINIPDSLKTIDEKAFMNREKLTDINIPDSLKTIGKRAFMNCKNLASINIPDGIEKICAKTFCECLSLQKADIPVGSKRIGVGAFQGCKNLTVVKISKGVETIGTGAFIDCIKLSKVDIADSVFSIEEAAFCDCSALTEVTIPASVERLGENVFGNCTNLKEIYYYRADSDFEEKLRQGNNAALILLDKTTNAQLKIIQPETVQPETIQPETVQPETVQPETVQPETIQPETVQPVTVQPETVQPATVQSETIQPETVQPATVQSETIQPETVQPATVQSETIQPETIQLATIQPATISKVDKQEIYKKIDEEAAKDDDSEKITWEIKGSTLIISGKGDMENYSPDNRPPYYDLRDKIQRVIVLKGITSIGDYAFADFQNLRQAIYSSTVKVVSDSAFKNCPNLKLRYKDGTIFKGGGGHEFSYGDCVTVIGGTIYSEVIVNAPARNKKIFLLVSDKKPNKKFIRKIKNLVDGNIDSDLLEIEDEAHKDNTGFPNVNLGDFKKCKRIGKRAFQNCVNIEFVILPPNLQEIDDGAFENCISLREVRNLPDSLKRIGKYAFKNCESLQSINLSANLEEIDDGAFENCTSLTSIILPPNLSKVGEGIFKGCERLEKIYYKAGSNFVDKLHVGNTAELIPYYKLTPQGGITIKSSHFLSSGNEIYYAEKVTIEDSFGELTVKIAAGMIDRFIFILDKPDTFIIKDNGMLGTVVTVAAQDVAIDAEIEQAWTTAQVQKNYCGKNVTWTLQYGTLTINGTGAMNDDSYKNKADSIQSVVIGEGVTSIGSYAFSYFNSLISVTLPDSLITIGESAFYYCGNLSSINFPAKLQTIGSSAFYGCKKLTNVNLPDGLKTIGSFAFYNCFFVANHQRGKTYDLSIPASVTDIGDSAFSSCKRLKNIKILARVTQINSGTFCGCTSLKNVTIPNFVTSIGKEAFLGCTSLANLSFLTSNIKEIGESAFKGCTALKNVAIPEGVEKIDCEAFKDCTGLEKVRLPSTIKGIKKLGVRAFSGCGRLKSIHYKSFSSDSYNKAFKDKLKFGNNARCYSY